MGYLLLIKMIPGSAILVQWSVFKGTFCETMSRPKIFPFQLILDVNECNSVNAHCSRAGFSCKECALIKLIGLLLTTMTGWNGIYSALVKAEKGQFATLTLSHKMWARKQTTEPKLVILVSFFSGEVTSYTDTSYSIYTYTCIVGSIRFPFFWATLYWWIKRLQYHGHSFT